MQEAVARVNFRVVKTQKALEEHATQVEFEIRKGRVLKGRQLLDSQTAPGSDI